MSRFEGKVAIVTGAASGVGRATVSRLASEGATVVGVDLNTDGLAETVALQEGLPVTSRVADISSRDEAHAVVAETVAAHGRLDVLANIAGILRTSHLADLTEADVDLVLNVNLKALIWTCQAAIPHLNATTGSIVNIASNSALMGAPYHSVYSASKGGVVALTRTLSAEFAKAPVRINAVAPGGIKTPMTKAASLPDDVDWDLIGPLMGFRDMSRPEDIAAVVAFVASDDARALHGAIVSADMGLTV